MITLTLPQIPPLQSARKCKNKFYDPLSKTKKNLKILVRSQYKQKPLEGPVHLSIWYWFEVPKSYSKKKKEQTLKAQSHTSKPDIDNLTKTLFDVLKGEIFNDDMQICGLNAYKYWSETPKTEVYIWPVKKE